MQFTRDPLGLRGALVKIGAVAEGSRIGNPEVEEVAHMLFAPGMKRIFATHPALVERLKAIDPRFDPREFAAVRSPTAGLCAATGSCGRRPASRRHRTSLEVADHGPCGAQRLRSSSAIPARCTWKWPRRFASRCPRR